MKARMNMYLVHVRCEVKRIPRFTVGSVEQGWYGWSSYVVSICRVEVNFIVAVISHNTCRCVSGREIKEQWSNVLNACSSSLAPIYPTNLIPSSSLESFLSIGKPLSSWPDAKSLNNWSRKLLTVFFLSNRITSTSLTVYETKKSSTLRSIKICKPCDVPHRWFAEFPISTHA